MAFAIGTATDFIDAARKLRDFADGTIDPGVHADFTAGGQVPVGQRWTVETNGGGQPTLPASGNATDGEVYLTGPGGGSDQIYVRYRTYRDVGSSVFNWELRGATDFLSTELFEDQTNSSAAVYYALANSSMNVWFFVNGFRIMAVMQSGSVFTCMYMGFIQQFATSLQWPYPLFIGGSANIQLRSISDNNYGHSCIPDPAQDAGQIRWADGNWFDVSNYSGSGGTRNRLRGRNIWPYTSPQITGPDSSNGNHSPNTDLYSIPIWSNFGGSSPRISSSFTGSETCFPCLVAFDTADPQAGAFGELDGIFAVFGESGLSAGDTLTINAETYIVFTNTWRTEFADYFAVKRE